MIIITAIIIIFQKDLVIFIIFPFVFIYNKISEKHFNKNKNLRMVEEVKNTNSVEEGATAA